MTRATGMVLLIAIVMAASAAKADPVTKTYDPGLGTLPDAQGFTLYDDGTSPHYTIAGSALHQGPTGVYQWVQATDVPIDFDNGFSMTATLNTLASNSSDLYGGRA